MPRDCHESTLVTDKTITVVSLLTAMQIQACVAQESEGKIIGSFAHDTNFLSINAGTATIRIHIGGTEIVAISKYPENWQIKNSTLYAVQAFREVHGIKVRFDNESSEIHHDGKYWIISRETLKQLLTAPQKSTVEIIDGALLINGARITNLPASGRTGHWYLTNDLDLYIPKTFHNSIMLNANRSKIHIADWQGKRLLLHLYDDSDAFIDNLILDQVDLQAGNASNITISGLKSRVLHTVVSDDSSIVIKSGAIDEVTVSESTGGKLTLSAIVTELVHGNPNNDQIIKKQTPRGTIEEFPKYGNFDIK